MQDRHTLCAGLLRQWVGSGWQSGWQSYCRCMREPQRRKKGRERVWKSGGSRPLGVSCRGGRGRGWVGC
jgi:hypothetical protein